MHTPFDQLTERGRVRRLRQIARAALGRYGLGDAETALLAVHTNTLFLVKAPGGPCVLRVGAPGQRAPLEIESELRWLAALRRDTALAVPEPLPTRGGELVVTAEAPGVPGPRHCVLFRWMPGRALGERVSPALAEQMGALLARLHQHADTFRPPAAFSSARWDTVWTFGRPAALDGAEPDPLWPPERRALVAETAARVQALLDRLYADPRGLRFLHCDFHPGNLKRHQGDLAVLDFDDSRWAYPVQDIGVALFYFLDDPGYRELRRRFLAGYRGVRDALPPDGEIDLCLAARIVDLVSYVLRFEVLSGEELEAWLPKVEGRIRKLGVLNAPERA
jgi:Ser/Thr protein kinase RdoA (MazF antagonist)